MAAEKPRRSRSAERPSPERLKLHIVTMKKKAMVSAAMPMTVASEKSTTPIVAKNTARARALRTTVR